MPTSTYVPLATVTLASADASITFSSLPAGYRDYVLVVNGTFSNNDYCIVRLNGDTGNNHTTVYMQGAASAQSATLGPTYGLYGNVNGIIAGTRFMSIFQIMDASATDKHKSVMIRTSDGSAVTFAGAGRWANTAAVTSITALTDVGNYQIGTTLSLYGIA